MKLCFDSIDEVKDFVKQLKGTRGGKDKEDNDGPASGASTGQAPAPIMPGQSQPGAAPNFQPAAPSFQPAPGFPGAPGGVDPAVTAIVGRITAKIDSAIASGQPAEAVTQWFRGQCGAEAANATLDQIKQTFLYKLAMPALENIAKLMNA